MCDSTPIGELCETRVAMMKSDTETFTNGHGENQEVLVVVVVPFVVVVVVVVVYVHHRAWIESRGTFCSC